jgi:subtilisin-like proprotein convertase family protein
MLRSAVSNVRWTGRAAALVAALAAAVWLVLLLGMPEEADAARRFKTVTKTFENTSAITIPTGSQAALYPSPIAASKLRRGKILDINVILRIFMHSFPDDVDVLLVGPRGHNAVIMSDVGGSSDVSNVTLLFDDEAASFLPDNAQLDTGFFKPTNIGVGDTFPSPAPAPSGLMELSTFDRTRPNGTWSLYVVDEANPDGGQFAGGWTLEIKAKVLRRR